MKLLRTERVWIHTHFVTDCVYLPADRAREITEAMAPVLEENRLVFGFHFAARGDEAGVVIVLECAPLPRTLEAIQAALERVIAPIPARPRRTKVEIEPPPHRHTDIHRRERSA